MNKQLRQIPLAAAVSRLLLQLQPGTRVRHLVTDELGTVVPTTWDQAGDRVNVQYDSDPDQSWHTQARKLEVVRD